MALLKTSIIEDYSVHEANKIIYPEYQFNCKKCNSEDNRFIISILR